jgi:hypothetical protein
LHSMGLGIERKAFDQQGCQRVVGSGCHVALLYACEIRHFDDDEAMVRTRY